MPPPFPKTYLPFLLTATYLHKVLPGSLDRGHEREVSIELYGPGEGPNGEGALGGADDAATNLALSVGAISLSSTSRPLPSLDFSTPIFTPAVSPPPDEDPSTALARQISRDSDEFWSNLESSTSTPRPHLHPRDVVHDKYGSLQYHPSAHPSNARVQDFAHRREEPDALRGQVVERRWALVAMSGGEKSLPEVWRTTVREEEERPKTVGFHVTKRTEEGE